MDEIEDIKKKVEKLKALSLTDNVHKLTPPTKFEDPNQSIAIVEALKADKLIVRLQIELQGLMYDHFSKKWVHYRNPVMNRLGIGNLIVTIQTIAETIEFSYFDKDEIPKYAKFLFRLNYPYFTVYHKEYELDRKDFNLVGSILFSYIVSALMKAKGAGHRNVVRGTYSEDLLGKLTKESQPEKRGLSNLSGMLKNPFRRSNI